jgi:uncharacterized protein YdhG (YjbR/CyaY superfamily)
MSAEVERCLGALPPDQRTALQALRAIIARRLPGYPEVISYAMPGFRQPGPKGRMVAGYAAFKVNCGYYPHSGTIVGLFPQETADYKISKGGILFTPDHPLSEALVLKLIDARLDEIASTGK